MKKTQKLFLILLVFSFLSVTANVFAQGVGDKKVFFIDSSYDAQRRLTVDSLLVKVSTNAYFFVDQGWWDSVDQNTIQQYINTLANEFDVKIYPGLTTVLGSEWTPGVDNDQRITVLIHPMRGDARGYVRTKDEYPKIQIPESNEREMVYLNSDYIEDSLSKSFLAHEFTHLITFNKKEKLYNIDEETWLAEMYSEYASTLLGYDDATSNTNLSRRAQDFSDEPFDSLTEWKETKYDYAVVNIFAQYLVDHYGKEILVDALNSNKKGIDSINYALQKNRKNKDFSAIFTDWAIASFINDCNFGDTYCYLNKNLNGFHIYPKINFLPVSGSTTLSFSDTTKNWAGNWFKVIGGKGNLKLNFYGGRNPFELSYVSQGKNGSYTIKKLNLDLSGNGELNISNFGTDIVSLTFIPIIKAKTTGFNGAEPEYFFNYTVATNINGQNNPPSSFNFIKNLYFGMNNSDVIQLKALLKAEGCVSGLANTGYFGVKTLEGVKCFQNKYKTEISAFAGYTIKSTGFVGVGTRTQLNKRLSGSI